MQLDADKIRQLAACSQDSDYLKQWHELLRDEIAATAAKEPPNDGGFLKIPREYFAQMPLMDYRSPEYAVPREFLQNSLDAGSRTISISTNSDSLVFEDDGCGMDEQTLTGKLLALGGSQKADGSTGGFGKAKEILYFCWPGYMIHTRDLLVIGAQDRYDIIKLPPELQRKGTASLIETWHDDKLCEQFFTRTRVPFEFKNGRYMKEICMEVASHCRTKTKFYLNGERIENKPWGRRLLTDGNMEVWKNHSRLESHPYMRISINGQYMFREYSSAVSNEEFHINFTGNSTELLSSNRDDLKGEAREAFNAWTRRLEVDSLSTLQEKDDEKQVTFSDARLLFYSPKEETAAVSITSDEPQEYATQRQVSATSGEASNSIDGCRPRGRCTDKEDRKVETQKGKDFCGFFTMSIMKGDRKDARTILSRKVNCQKLFNMLSAGAVACMDALGGIVNMDAGTPFALGLEFDRKVAGTYREVGPVRVISVNPMEIAGTMSKWTKENVQSAAGMLLHLLTHEFTHALVDAHNERFSSLHFKLNKELWERHPQILKEMTDAAFMPVNSRKMKRSEPTVIEEEEEEAVCPCM